MSFWYIPPKQNQKHALIGTRDWSDCNFKAFFDESIAKEDDNFWYLFMNIQEIKPGMIKNINDNSGNWKFEPQLCLLRFAKKEYEKKGQKIQPSMAEKFFCKTLSELEKDKHYSGYIHIQETPQMECLISDEPKLGDMVVSAEYIQVFKNEIVRFIPTEAKTIEDNIMDSIGGNKFGGGYGGKKAESESERLNGRLAFIVEQFNLAYGTNTIKSIGDIYTLMVGEEVSKGIMAKEIWKLLLQIIGNQNT